MDLSKKIRTLAILRHEILHLIERRDNIFEKAYAHNPWFVPEFIQDALIGLTVLLEESKLENWLSNYRIPDKSDKNIGVIMAGNLPVVGFHDLLTVILSGNRGVVKLSSKDEVLLPFLMNILVKIEPEFTSGFTFEWSFKNIDAIIATGSDNTSRYFNHAFKKIPHIIRKNRTSCGILNGQESQDDFEQLSMDIFSYFGLGCRNVSKIYIPQGFNPEELPDALSKYAWIKNHRKYFNNYRYQFATYTLEKRHFFDGGFFILTRDADLFSPISCLYYEEYESKEYLPSILQLESHRLQCIVTKEKWLEGSVEFGMAQYPDPWDYADRIDTMDFILDL